MKKIILLILASFFISCEQGQITESEYNDEVTIKSYNVSKMGYGQNAVAELINNTDKKIDFVFVEFNWYDVHGKIISSQRGSARNIAANSTFIVDSYFDKMPEGATCEPKIKEVVF